MLAIGDYLTSAGGSGVSNTIQTTGITGGAVLLDNSVASSGAVYLY
jgi:hypothetical protein